MNLLYILDEFKFLREDEFLRITLADGNVIIIDKTDLVKSVYGGLRIFRSSGIRVFINPEYVVMVHTMTGERRFHE